MTKSYSTDGRAKIDLVVEVKSVSKIYGLKQSGGRSKSNSELNSAIQTRALNDVSFCVKSGEFIAIMGPSGSGKSTLLNCISTIDIPTNGQIFVGGKDVTTLSGQALSDFRRDELGFIFQDTNLLDTLTGYENIALPLSLQRVNTNLIDSLVQKVASTLSISDVLDKYPYQMSGGQKQRVAAARATITEPSIILADEPTGALDTLSSKQLLNSLVLLNSMGATILMVTHDSLAASYCSRVLFLRDGVLHGEILRGVSEAKETFYKRISEIVSNLEEQSEMIDYAG